MDEGQPRKSLTIPEALSSAIKLHQHGQLATAETLYRRILEAVPDHPDALHFLGVLCQQLGRSEEAERLLRRCLELVPGHADAHCNLGRILSGQGRPEEAVAALQRAVELSPDHADAHSNLGVILKGLGRLEEAEAALSEALRCVPDHAGAHFNLGNVLQRLGRPEEAAGAHRRALKLKPDHAEAYHCLFAALSDADRVEEAREVLREWLAFQPGNPVPRHLLASVSGGETPDRAPDGFVRASFDDLADGYDERLASLDYRLPERLGEIFEAELGAPAGDLAVLDAGCGTGLGAAGLRPFAARLIGVDLAPEMLALARKRDLYDELFEGELTAFLLTRPGEFHAIACVETLLYFGDLAEVLGAFGKALREDGLLFLSVEKGDGEMEFALDRSGRYRHSEGYLRAALASAGLTLTSYFEETLRTERGRPIAGLLVTARKGAG